VATEKFVVVISALFGKGPRVDNLVVSKGFKPHKVRIAESLNPTTALR